MCVVSVPILSPWWDTTISLIFEAHLPSSSSDHPEHLQQVVTGEIIHCLTALEVIVWSALSSLVEPERMIVTTWMTNHLVLCPVLLCWLYSLRNQWWHLYRTGLNGVQKGAGSPCFMPRLALGIAGRGILSRVQCFPGYEIPLGLGKSGVRTG